MSWNSSEKAVPSTERASVAVGVRRVAEEDAGGQVVVTVDDRGPGVPPEARTRIFERFRRGSGSAGTGLGLTLVAQQTALHRGTVTVTDGPGRLGARFEVRLPSTGGTLPARRDWLITTAGTKRSQSFPKDAS